MIKIQIRKLSYAFLFSILCLTLYSCPLYGMEDNRQTITPDATVVKVAKTHYQAHLSYHQGAYIPQIILAHAEKLGVEPERITITWDFDDTLAVRRGRDYLAELTRYGHFSDSQTYSLFKRTVLDVLGACLFINRDRNYTPNEDYLNRVFWNNPAVLSFFGVTSTVPYEECGYYKFVHCRDNFSIYERSMDKVLLSQILSKALETRGDKGPYIVKVHQLWHIFLELKERKATFLGICSNGQLTQEKEAFISKLTTTFGLDLPWIATPEEGDNNKVEGIYQAFQSKKVSSPPSSRSLLKCLARNRITNLLVHIDDKGTVFDHHEINKPSKTATLLIHWDKLQSDSSMIAVNDIEEAKELLAP